MQAQRLSLASTTLSIPILSPSHKPKSTKLSFLIPNSARGFYNPLKRVFKSPSDSKSCGGFVGIKCVMVEEGSECDDGFYIRKCVEIARKGIGFTSPNPMVGCVIVKDGQIVGQGFHPKAGQPHAEVFALRDAGDLAENATAYVSLEPCNHFGRTPPCTEALIKAKVKRVVVGMVDPNPIVASKGVERLRNAGIEVTIGVETELCESLNESYIHHMLTGKPLVTLRYSLSVNGQIIDQLGEGAAESGGYYSRLLQEYDAVIVSSASVTNKFSVSTSQEPGANQPQWIIAATDHKTSLQASNFPTEAATKLIIFSDKEDIVEPKLADKGIETVVLDQMSLDDILEYCNRQGFCSVLIDLRGSFDEVKELLQEGFEKKLLQKVVVEILPVWAESSDENSSLVLKNLGRKLDMKKLQPKISGKSVLLEGYF